MRLFLVYFIVSANDPLRNLVNKDAANVVKVKVKECVYSDLHYL